MSGGQGQSIVSWEELLGLVDTGHQFGRARGGLESDTDSDTELDHDAPPDGALGNEPVPEPALGQGHVHHRAPKAGTGEWFFMHRAEPICPGHSVTIVEACHWLATLKSSTRMTDEVVDQFCLMVSKFLLPPGNLFPTSYHMVKATLGVENSKACTEHICDKCWSVFPRLHHSEFENHAEDVCQATGIPGCLGGVCGNPRFERTETGTVLPKRCLYQFNIADTVRDLLEVSLSDWDQVAAQRAADFNQPETFWGSPAGKQLDASCGHLFSNPPPGEVAVNFALGEVLLHL